MANYILLERIELNASAASVTFANIPQTGYTDLKVVASARSTTSNTGYGRLGLYMAINGSSSTFTGKDVLGFGSSGTTSNSYSTNRCGWIDANDATANTFSSTEIYIPNYSSSNNKSFSVDFATENNNASELVTGFAANLWSTTTTISSLAFTIESSYSFSANSTFSLYGLAAVGTTPVIAPKASGGNVIAYDGTYWYHTFLSTGAFVPQTGLTANVLVVAGGGSGGNNASGGGGAGGLLYSSSKAFASAVLHTVTIGGGGANTTSYSTGGTNGIDSTIIGTGFTTLTAIGGGSGQGPVATAAGSGGSGGGASGYSGSSARGTGTSGQGNNGGTATSSGESGGGGGAGAVGGNGGNNSARNGVGGAGVNTYSSWASATNTGVSGYYAGGGGGGAGQTANSNTAGGAGGGGNGAGTDQNPVATAGTVNSGGGGGGTGYGNTSGSSNTAGGSGIVIIRYAMA